MKKLVMISLVSTAALMMFAKPADAIVKEDNTDVGVSFKSNDDTIPGKGPYKDNLALVWKPNAFQFGEQTAVAGISTYTGVPTVEDQYLVVNEDRATDKITIWDLKATMSKLQVKGTDPSGDGLGATLEFKMNTLQAYSIGDKLNEDNDYDAPNPSKDPDKDNGVDIPGTGRLSLGADIDSATTGVSLGGELDSTKSVTVKLTADGSSSVVVMAKTDAEKKLKGGYATKITDKKLTVTTNDASQLAGKKYSGVVTWTLDNTVK